MNMIQAIGCGIAAGALVHDNPMAALGLIIFGIATGYAEEWRSWANSKA